LTEKRLLQGAVALAGLVPVLAGALGILRPEHLFSGPLHAMTHAAYLHGLLLGLGLGFWYLVPTIERQSRLFSLLTGMVLLGGLARVLTAGLFPFQLRVTIFPLGKHGSIQTWH